MAMFLVMMHVAQGNEVLYGILSLVLVVLLVMKFEHFTWVVWRQHGAAPAALDALKTISFQNLDANGVRDCPVVFVGLPIFFQNVNADGQVFPAAAFRDDGPA